MAIFLIFYTYFLYPGLLFVLVALKRTGTLTSKPARPFSVTGIIAVYNEENILPEKLNNLKSIHYPEGNISFLFGSDGSTDKTNEIIETSNLENVLLRPFSDRRGKVSILNDLVNEATGEIIFFSDANTLLQPEALQNLVRHFSDPTVGAVSGKLNLRSDRSTAGGRGESSYWSYENHVKNLESKLYSILGATGGIYAIRRSLYIPMPASVSVTDDFLIPMKIVEQGYRVVFEPEAIGVEETPNSMIGEFKRKSRIGAQNYHTIPFFAKLLHPRFGFVAFALWSHKMVRWCVPFLLILLVAVTAILGQYSAMYSIFFSVFIVFVVIGLLGMIAEKLKLRIGIFSLPYYFLAMNGALFAGFIKFLFGSQKSTWDVLR